MQIEIKLDENCRKKNVQKLISKASEKFYGLIGKKMP